MTTKRIPVRLGKRSYPIYIGANILARLPALIQKAGLGSDAVVITMPKLARRYGAVLTRLLEKTCRSVLVVTVPDSEKSKSAALALRIISRITRFDKNKKLFLVAFGGGVVGDLTGFVAAIYKRGVPYIQIPTTLLAQIDSAIGGKTAVDTDFGKNLIGSFYQPRMVVSDTVLLGSLPRRQLISGLSEAVKYGAITDPALFRFLESRAAKIIKGDPAVLAHIVKACAAIKARIVEEDETDKKGVRAILNFGHTFAHGIEAASSYRINHGEAVAIGMACACDLARALKRTDEQTCERVERLCRRFGLPTRTPGADIERTLRSMSRDKKFTKGGNRFVLIVRIGKTQLEENIPWGLVRKVLIKRSRANAS